jgi:hypothetical protein
MLPVFIEKDRTDGRCNRLEGVGGQDIESTKEYGPVLVDFPANHVEVGRSPGREIGARNRGRNDQRHGAAAVQEA